VLDNDPEAIPTLTRGAMVEVPLDQIADYALYRGDKRLEGYVFTAIVLRRQGKPLPP
jgi:uncharacterized protein YegJ (DUF2314 family)